VIRSKIIQSASAFCVPLAGTDPCSRQQRQPQAAGGQVVLDVVGDVRPASWPAPASLLERRFEHCVEVAGPGAAPSGAHRWGRGLGSRDEADAGRGFSELLQRPLHLSTGNRRRPRRVAKTRYQREWWPARGRGQPAGPDSGVEPEPGPAARGPVRSRRPGPLRGVGTTWGKARQAADRVRASGLRPPAGECVVGGAASKKAALLLQKLWGAGCPRPCCQKPTWSSGRLLGQRGWKSCFQAPKLAIGACLLVCHLTEWLLISAT